MLLAGLVLAYGWAADRQGRHLLPPTPSLLHLRPPPASSLFATGEGTCAALAGSVCSVGEDCPGAWISASDSLSCSEPCEKEYPGAALTLEPYQLSEENPEIGDII
jgi:hypothetical protein